MADIAIGEAITAGFGVIRRQPLAVLLWGLVQLAVTGLIIAALAPFYMALFTELARAGSGGQPPDMQAFQPMALQMQGASYLLDLVGAATGAVVYCAVFRSVLHPEQNRYGYLRVGAPELFTLVLMIAGYIAFVIALLVAMIPIIIVVGILVATHAVAAAIIFGVVIGVAAVVAAIYVALRFSLVVPMMVDDGKFHLMESWALTRGKVWSLFMVGLITVLILLLAEIVVLAIFGVAGFAGLAAIAGGMDHLGQFFKQPSAAILSGMAPLLAAYAVLWVPLAGCAYAIMAAPFARAYRDLVQPDVSGTFS